MRTPPPIFSVFLKLELWLAVLAVLLGMLSTALLPWTLLLLLVFWPVRRWVHGNWTIRTPVDGPILLLVVLLPVTLAVSALPEVTLPQVYRLLIGIGFFYTLVNWIQSRSQLRLALIGLLAAGLGLSGLAVFNVNAIQTVLQSAGLVQPISTMLGDSINANVMAGSLILLFPLGLTLSLAERTAVRFLDRSMAAGMMLISAAILLLTQSRSALIALFVVLISWVALRWRRGWILLSVGALALGLVYLLGQDTLRELFHAYRHRFLGLDERVEIWARASYIIQDFPLTGVGMGSFTAIADRLYPFLTKAAGTVSHAHNLFLQIAVDLGIPGLLAWLMVLLTAIVLFWKLFRTGLIRQDGWAASLGLAFLCSQIALVVHGLTDAVTWGQVRPAPLVWGIWGVGLAAWRVLAQDNSARTELVE